MTNTHPSETVPAEEAKPNAYDYSVVPNAALVRKLATFAQALRSKSPLWHMPSDDPSSWTKLIAEDAFKAAETELLKRLGEPAPKYVEAQA